MKLAACKLGLGTALLCALPALAAPTVTASSPHIFTGGDDGARPAGLALGSDGKLYGGATLGGHYGGGTLFQVTAPGGFKVLQEFVVRPDPIGAPLGRFPGPLVRGNGNSILGTDTSDRLNGTIAPSGLWQNVFVFSTLAPYFTLSRCVYQNDNLASGFLVEDRAGNLYGTAGDSRSGIVFKCTPGVTPVPADGGGQFSILHTFTGTIASPGPEGGDPQDLLLAADGNFYGVNAVGSNFSGGEVWKMTPSGTVTILHEFLDNAEGGGPRFLIAGRDGNFYGTTDYGGAYDQGTVFRISPAGNFTLLYSFTGQADGWTPLGLTQGSDGNFYGVTEDSSSGRGTVFQITPAGALTTLYGFDTIPGVNMPNSPLVEASPGVFFGTTLGPYNGNVYTGAVYKLVIK